MSPGMGNLRDSPFAKFIVTPEITLPVVWQLQTQTPTLHEPGDLQSDASVHKVEEISRRVLERKSVRVSKLLGYEQVKLGW